MSSIKLDILAAKQRGLYCVPGNVILKNHPAVPTVYLGLMRYTNAHNEIVSCVKYLAEYQEVKSVDTKDGSLDRTRKALTRLRNLGVLANQGFDDCLFRVHDAFKLHFNKKYGWGYNRSQQLLGCGYVKESEIENLRKYFRNNPNRDRTVSFISALQLLLFARLYMEKPAGKGGFAQSESSAFAILMENQITEGIDLKSTHITRRLGCMRAYGLLDYSIRLVREKKRSRQMKVYLIVNHTASRKKTLRMAERELKKIFYEVTSVEEPQKQQAEEAARQEAACES